MYQISEDPEFFDHDRDENIMGSVMFDYHQKENVFHIFVNNNNHIKKFYGFFFPTYQRMIDANSLDGYRYLHSKNEKDYERYGAESEKGAFLDESFVATLPNSNDYRGKIIGKDFGI